MTAPFWLQHSIKGTEPQQDATAVAKAEPLDKKVKRVVQTQKQISKSSYAGIPSADIGEEGFEKR